MNPLLAACTQPQDYIPFDQITPDHFIPAIEQAIKDAKVKLKALKNNTAPPDFANSIAGLEEIGDCIILLSNIFFNLHAANTNDRMQEIAEDFNGLLTDFSSDVYLDRELFARVQAVYEKRRALNLSPEQERLLELTHKQFVRNGALLNDADKDLLRALDRELSRLSLEFGDNVLAEQNEYELRIENETDLAGLPESAISAAAGCARERGYAGGWVFTLDYPSYGPFMKFARNRELRKQMYNAYASVGFKDNDYDNKEIVKSIANLRYKRARLLGYESHAHFVLEERMAGNPEKVQRFLDEIYEVAKPVADSEIRELEDYQFELDGIRDMQRWDYSYYLEHLRRKNFRYDENTLRPYLKLEHVLDGAFTVANKLYDLVFYEMPSVPVYHKDVTTFEVHDAKRKQFIGLLYVDLFPRESKRNGAWKATFRDQAVRGGKDQRPHVSIVCNFTPPGDTEPALLSYEEARTLFHEFGHALHSLLSRCSSRTLSGTHVYWDFVELPSQIMENWLDEPECLDLFARHYKSDEKIPLELIERVKQGSRFHEGTATLRQLSFAMLDLAWHSRESVSVEDVGSFEENIMRKTDLMPAIPSSNMSCHFSHIFDGGYSAGYYSYKWAEVLDSDAFELFRQEGIFNREIARRFREHVLEKGGSAEPSELYRNFRGKEPSIDALLRRSGFVQ